MKIIRGYVRMTQQQISQKLFELAGKLGSSQDKKINFIKLPSIINNLAKDIALKVYKPSRFHVFVVLDPKLREIFAPAFRDRLAQQWLISLIEPTINKQFIDDNFANRKEKGTHAAIERVQHFMRKKDNTYYCQIDIQSFFPSIDRTILFNIWKKWFLKLRYDSQTLLQINYMATQIIMQSPIDPYPIISGKAELLTAIPKNKSLFYTKESLGLPIGSLASQFFSNLYLNELDQYVKHKLKIKSYLRYVDDMMILGKDKKELIYQKNEINLFLHKNLHLSLHPNKTVLQRVKQGANFLGAIIFPHHTYPRERQIKSLKVKIKFFNKVIKGNKLTTVDIPIGGIWDKYINKGECF
jgi:RNA-directed DNA polymerase